MPSLKVERIHIRIGSRRVLSGVSLHAKPGEIVSVIGPSGCGKTTLARCILGELRPERGRVLIDGQDVTDVRVWKRGVGIVYQRYALFPHMTVWENIAYGLRVRKDSPERIQARVEKLLGLVHLEGKGDYYPERLSGGERQRVAVARALAVEPRILLLDEAFTALDASTRHNVIQEVLAIIKRLAVTTIVITHDQEEAFLFSKHVVVLNEGKVVVSGDPETVMAYPHPFIKDFVKMVLFHRAKVRRYSNGKLFVELENGSRLSVDIPGVREGDTVQVTVKKARGRESIEVWPRARP